MPFISKDWRSPGEAWVKYDGGWEKKSVVTISDNSNIITEHLDLVQTINTATTSKKVDLEVKQQPQLAEAVATLSRGPRKKNLSECDKENHDPVAYHRLLLQEHVRRIRGQRRLDEAEDEPHELPPPAADHHVANVEHHRNSPYRTNRYLYTPTSI